MRVRSWKLASLAVFGVVSSISDRALSDESRNSADPIRSTERAGANAKRSARTEKDPRKQAQPVSNRSHEKPLLPPIDDEVPWKSRVIQLPSATNPEEHRRDRDKPPVVSAVRIHPESSKIALAGDDHTVSVWDPESSSLIWRLDAHTDWVRAIAFSPTGDRLYSAGNDRRILEWNPAIGKLVSEWKRLDHAIAALAVSHSGAYVAAVGFGSSIDIFDAASGERVKQFESPSSDLRAVEFSPDDTTLAVGGRDGVVRVWSFERGAVIREVPAHTQRVRSVSFSPDGRWLVSAGEDRTAHVTDLLAERERRKKADRVLPKRPGKIMAAVFCSDSLLAVAGSDNAIRLWDLESGKEIGCLRGHTGSVVAIDYRDGFLVSGSYDTTVRIWESQEEVADQPPEDSPRVGGSIHAIEPRR